MPALRRALVWLGITDDDEEYEPAGVRHPQGVDEAPAERPAERGRVQVVSPGSPRKSDDDSFEERRSAVVRPFNPIPDRPKIHLVLPTKYTDVQEIGDRMKSDQPVIINLEGVDKDLRRRIIDFSSGLTYALGGKVKEVSTSVYLLSPARVEVADEEMFRLRQRTVAKGVGGNGN